MSWNEQTKKFEYKTVVQTFVNQTQEIVKVKIKGEKNLIEATPEHPFYVKTFHQARDNTSNEDDEGEWLSAKDLQLGDFVKAANGTWKQVLTVELEIQFETVYNFEVEDNHNYFVGEIGFLVHNNCSEAVVAIAKNVTKDFGIGSCIQCAEQLVNAFKSVGIRGEVLRLDLGYKANIWSNTAGQVISTNGVHEAVRVGDLVFDNIHKNGIPYEQWLKDFVTNLPGGGVGTPGTRPF